MQPLLSRSMGEYDFQTKLYRTNLNIVRGLEYPSDFEIAIDGKPVHHVTIGGNADLAAMFEKPTDTGDAVDARMRVKVPVTGRHARRDGVLRRQPAGEGHAAAAAVPAQLGGQLRLERPPAHPDGDDHRARSPSTGPGDSASRREIFVCTPKGAEPRIAEPADAGDRRARGRSCRGWPVVRIAGRSATREMRPIMQFYAEGRARAASTPASSAASSGFWPARCSSSASSRIRPTRCAGRPYRVSDVELASRLSFFLWSSIPDEELLQRRRAGPSARRRRC